MNRLASEYQNTIASATGDSTRHSVLSRDAANTNTADDTITKTAASGVVIAPRGSSRIAVRGLSASNRASTRRLKPIAALRALTMHTTIHADLRPRERLLAPGQQRAGQRKRQREHRVAEADEREIGRELVHGSASTPATIAVGLDAGHQVFFHIGHVVRHADGDERRALARFDAAERRRRSRAPSRPVSVALSSSARAGTVGAMRRASASSLNMFRSSTLARLSVPNATSTSIA